MFSPGIRQIADDLNTTKDAVIGCTTGFVIMLGIGPLILAPLSETFGRRKVYIYCYTAFSILQIPAALAPNIATLLTVRTISGFFGAVAIANGKSGLVRFNMTSMLTYLRRWNYQWSVELVLFVETLMLTPSQTCLYQKREPASSGVYTSLLLTFTYHIHGKTYIEFF